MAKKEPETEKPAALPVTKPEPTEAEQAEILAHAERKKARRRAPRFSADLREDGQVQVMPTGVHAEAADARTMNAFGITSVALAERLISQIATTTHLQSSTEPVSEKTLNAALAAVTGIAPRDEAEAMLAVQMVSVHWLAMDLLRKANDRAQRTDAGTLAVKLLRTFPAQLEALKRYRSAGEQRVVVQHQHVNVTADQAAVQVTGAADPAPGGRGAASKPEERSHGQPLAHAPEPTMRGPEPARDAVPVASHEGTDPLSVPRRG